MTDFNSLEQELNSYSKETRRSALERLAAKSSPGEKQSDGYVNMHCHSFFSYNPDNDSPSRIAWKARQAGLKACGIVDFDVLDGVDEFLAAAALLGFRAAAGIETRVFLEELAEVEINSPGEPGIAYHMGVGMPSSSVPEHQREFLDGLKTGAQERNRAMIARVNSATAPLELDYEADVLPLTPRGNATERHLCLAYARKAATIFSDGAALRAFWEEKLGPLPESLELPEGFELQALIRKKFMKQGGVGYAAPDSGSFPKMGDFNQFVSACGGIPAMAWLDGGSAGERDLRRLLEIEIGLGTAAVNLIPDRNFTRGIADEKLENLRAFIALANELGLPVLAGTELNAPGLRFVDDFEAPELKPFLPTFLEGALIAYAHSALQRAAGMGYCSAWGEINFPERHARNAFFRRIGAALAPDRSLEIAVAPDMEPEQVIAIACGELS